MLQLLIAIVGNACNEPNAEDHETKSDVTSLVPQADSTLVKSRRPARDLIPKLKLPVVEFFLDIAVK